MPKRLLFLLLSIVCSLSVVAQDAKKTGIIRGKLINSVTKAPYNDVKITLPQLNTFTLSEGGGNFSLTDVPYGSHIVIVGGGAVKRDTITVVVDKELVDMGEVNAIPSERNDEIPTISIEENASHEEENSSSSSDGSSGFYTANQDPFLKIASITFGTYRFRPRGYDNSDVQINGIPLQDLETGFSSYGLIGGLNDVLRDRTFTYGLRPSEFTFGTSKGSTQINATAADQRKGTTVSYFNSNRAFRNRVMATYSTGIMKNGWAFSLSGSRRWAQEGYFAGTFYDASSFYGAVSKVTKKSQFNLTAFGAPTKRARQTLETNEVYDSLAKDHYYNGAWGYQDGKKRNGFVLDVFQPVVVANYTYKPSEKLRWNTALGYEFGKRSNSKMDFYNGYNPNPTYYRNLPSYYIYGDNTPNTASYAAVRANILAHPEELQMDWNSFYQSNYANFDTVFDANGIKGNTVAGRQSIFTIYNDVDKMSKVVLNSNVQAVIKDGLEVFGGLQVISQRDEYYKELIDLLGGDFFVNNNQFAVQGNVPVPNYNQNDLNKPNQIVKVGDRYGYDFIMRVMHANLWGQVTYDWKKFDFFAALEGGRVSFSREGLTKNGLFPENSYGKSPALSFTTYRGKAGVTYKFDLKNMAYLNGAYFADAPRVDYSYISEKSRDFTVDNPTLVKTKAAELVFLHKTALFNFRITGYVTDVTDNIINKRYFNDDPAFNTFVNYLMTGVNTRSTGTELSASYKINQQFNITAIAAIGQSFYTNRPDVAVYYDNDPTKAAVSRQVYIKNYYLGVGPQSIYSVDLSYRPRNYWHANMNINYMDRNYVEINPDRRTQQAADMVIINTPQWHKIYDQEKMPSAFTVDISAGKSFNVSDWYKNLHHKTILNFNMGIVNLLNNTNIKVTGFEQLRYDFAYHNADKFPNKYSYAYGINYYASISLKF